MCSPLHQTEAHPYAERMPSLVEHSRQHRKLCLRREQWPLGPGATHSVTFEVATEQA